MQNYEKLKEIIQEANPKIMELELGCELKSNNKGVRRFFTGRNAEENELFFSDIDQVGFEDNYFYTEERVEDINKSIILGRQIRLSDILHALPLRICGIHSHENGTSIINGKLGELLRTWHFDHDSLDWHYENQPETIEFLIAIFIKE